MIFRKIKKKINMDYFRNQQIYFLISFFLLFITLNLTGCVDLSGTKASSERKTAHYSANTFKNAKTNKKYHSKNGEVHTMRGGLGIFSKGMNQLRDSVAERYNVPVSSAMWYDAGKVRNTIAKYYFAHKAHRPIILVGHSLGANEQIKVARELGKAGIPVDLLVTVDAVSQTIVPPNVKHALNIYKPGFVPMFSGLKLRAVNPNATEIENVNVSTLGVKVNHFTLDKDKIVQAMILDKVEKVLSNANRKEA